MSDEYVTVEAASPVHLTLWWSLSKKAPVMFGGRRVRVFEAERLDDGRLRFGYLIEGAVPKANAVGQVGPPPKDRAVLVFDWLEAKHTSSPTTGLCAWWGASWKVAWPNDIEAEWWDDSGWLERYLWLELPTSKTEEGPDFSKLNGLVQAVQSDPRAAEDLAAWVDGESARVEGSGEVVHEGYDLPVVALLHLLTVLGDGSVATSPKAKRPRTNAGAGKPYPAHSLGSDPPAECTPGAGKPEPVDIAAALAICNAATPGPWSSGWDDPESVDDDEWPLIRAGTEAIIAGVWYDGPRVSCVRENGAFIVAAREGWPAALAQLAEVTAERDRLADEVASWAESDDMEAACDRRMRELGEATAAYPSLSATEAWKARNAAMEGAKP